MLAGFTCVRFVFAAFAWVGFVFGEKTCVRFIFGLCTWVGLLFTLSTYVSFVFPVLRNVRLKLDHHPFDHSIKPLFFRYRLYKTRIYIYNSLYFQIDTTHPTSGECGRVGGIFFHHLDQFDCFLMIKKDFHSGLFNLI